MSTYLKHSWLVSKYSFDYRGINRIFCKSSLSHCRILNAHWTTIFIKNCPSYIKISKFWNTLILINVKKILQVFFSLFHLLAHLSLSIITMIEEREKKRDLTQSNDKSLYTDRILPKGQSHNKTRKKNEYLEETITKYFVDQHIL